MEKAFFVFRLPADSRNVRNEIKKGKKVYFFDNGIRNAIVDTSTPLYSRVDTDALWEIFLISEPVKHLTYQGDFATGQFFSRTTQHQEINYVEEVGGKMHAWELNWSSKKSVKFSESLIKAYPHSERSLVTPDYFEDFIGLINS